MDIEKLKLYEENFQKNRRYGEFSKPTFEFFKGDLPIILTAPHTTKTRNLKTGEIKKSEPNTGSIALYTRDETGCHVMVRNNFFPETFTTLESCKKDMLDNYKKLSEYIEKHKILYLLDIHGALLKFPNSIAVGTSNDEFIFYENIWKDIITESFLNFGIKTDFNTKFQASNPTTISRIIYSNNRIKTTQFEIDQTLRILKNDSERIQNCVKGMENCVKGISRQLHL